MSLSLPPEMIKKILEEGTMRCKSMEDVQDFLKQFTGPLLEKILEAEMDIHLGYKKHDIIGYNTGNSRNGNSKKKIRTTSGDIDLDIPRDRKGEFQPQIIGKYQSNMNSIEEKIVGMYALGLSTQDISDHVKEIYGTGISADMISNIKTGNRRSRAANSKAS